MKKFNLLILLGISFSMYASYENDLTNEDLDNLLLFLKNDSDNRWENAHKKRTFEEEQESYCYHETQKILNRLTYQKIVTPQPRIESIINHTINNEPQASLPFSDNVTFRLTDSDNDTMIITPQRKNQMLQQAEQNRINRENRKKRKLQDNLVHHTK